VAGDLAPGREFRDPPPGQPIPVLASRRLLEVYNKTIAPAWNLRRLPPGLDLVGLQIPVQVGFSIIPLKTEDRVVDARLALAGLSDRVPLYSLAIPVETVRRLHQEYGKADPGYSSVVLETRRPDDVPGVAEAVRRMGFAVDEGERAIAERVGLAITVTAGALALLALLMTALAALAIAQSLSASVRSRTRDIAILEAVGATAGDVRALVLAEAALVGLAGGVLGVLVAWLAARGADAAALRFLPDFPFRPETFFTFPPWLFALGVGGVLVFLADILAGAVAYQDQWVDRWVFPAWLVSAHEGIRAGATITLLASTAAMLFVELRSPRWSLPRLLYVLGIAAMVTLALRPRSLFLFLVIWTSQHWILATGDRKSVV
jgi:hypothetical protein